MSVRMRQILAALAGLGGAGVFAAFIFAKEHVKKQAYVPVVALVVAAVAAQLRPLGAQLLARGLWWSNLVLGVLLCATGNGPEEGIGEALAAGCGVALVVADRRALAEASEGAGYRPVAYAGTLQLLMVLALADAQTLGLFALIFYPQAQSVLLGVGALGLLAGFAGLYRLSLAGVAATMATSLGVLVALATQAVRVDRDLDAPLMVISAVQLAVPLPMLASIALRRPLPAPPARLRGRLADAVVVALVVGAVAWGYFRRVR